MQSAVQMGGMRVQYNKLRSDRLAIVEESQGPAGHQGASSHYSRKESGAGGDDMSVMICEGDRCIQDGWVLVRMNFLPSTGCCL